MIADPTAYSPRRRSFLSRLLAAALTPAGVIYYCPTCKTYYDPSDPTASYPHNNH